MAGFGVVVDTCALYPMPVADTLLLAAQRGLYVLRWTEDLFGELEAVMMKRGRTPEQARRRVDAMKGVFAESEVLGYDRMRQSLQTTMPDPNDAHVLAAAIRSGAERIVTFNLAHFPPPLLAEHRILAYHPDSFLCDVVDIYPSTVVSLLRHQAARQTRPPVSFEKLLIKLETDAPEFIAQVRKVVEIEQAEDQEVPSPEEDAPPVNLVPLARRRRRSRKPPNA
jgi:hypothetical protein